MDPRSVGVAKYEDIINFEVRRQGGIEGHDREDLMQEMRALVGISCLPKLDDTNSGRTYVRRSVRNALTNLQRAALTEARAPRDRRGRTMRMAYLEEVGSRSNHPWVETWSAPQALPDEVAETAQLIEALQALSLEDQTLLIDAFVLGATRVGPAVEDARKRARHILTMILNPVDQERRWPKRVPRIPARSKRRRETMAIGMKWKDTQPCHVDGTEPAGYETEPEKPEDADVCRNCLDKFTCLSDGLRRGLISGSLDVDPEAKVAIHGLMTYEKVRDRINKRVALIEAGKPIPANLTYDNIPDVPAERLAQLSSQPPEPPDNDGGGKTTKKEKTMSEETTPKKTKAKKKPKTGKVKAAEAPPPTKVDAPATKKTKAKKKAKTAEVEAAPKPKAKAKKKADGKASKAKTGKKAKAPKTGKKAKAPKAKSKGEAPNNRLGEKGSFKYPGKVKEHPDGRLELPNGRFIPAPKELTSEKMEIALARINEKLALPVELKPGMKLIQHRRDGDNVIVTIKKNGFHLNRRADGEEVDAIYSSLSAACMVASYRFVSGADMFNFEKHKNLELKGKGVPGGSFRSGDAEE